MPEELGGRSWPLLWSVFFSGLAVVAVGVSGDVRALMVIGEIVLVCTATGAALVAVRREV